MVSVTIGGSAFGFLGVFLAVPAGVVVKVLVKELWSRHLEGRPETPEKHV